MNDSISFKLNILCYNWVVGATFNLFSLLNLQINSFFLIADFKVNIIYYDQFILLILSLLFSFLISVQRRRDSFEICFSLESFIYINFLFNLNKWFLYRSIFFSIVSMFKYDYVLFVIFVCIIWFFILS